MATIKAGTYVGVDTPSLSLPDPTPTDTVTITYNGTTLAELEAGQTATFPQGVKAKTDVSIAFGSKGSITYKGVTTAIEAGKTANLLCSGKKFGTDVVVSVEAEVANYLTFRSPSSFTLKTYNTTKNWDGTLEYSTDKSTWSTWDGTTTLSANDGKLYLRGTGNTIIAGGEAKRWVLSGSNIACEGNIENILDYATVANGEHPTMAKKCYESMFYNCTSLTTAPELPATTLARACYLGMFHDCTSLAATPELPAMTLAEWCYVDMFNGCINLTTACALPATTLTELCYARMFADCASLTTLPELPATTLTEWCYNNMFYNCAKIKVSMTQTDVYTTPYRIPSTGTGTIGDDSLNSMFDDTGGTFKGTPSINTTYYTSNTVV